jgi:hypothetical protein
VIHSFAVVIDGVDLASPESPDADALYEAGCDDALLVSDAGVQRAMFDREAPSFAEAVASAITAIETSRGRRTDLPCRDSLTAPFRLKAKGEARQGPLRLALTTPATRTAQANVPLRVGGLERGAWDCERRLGAGRCRWHLARTSSGQERPALCPVGSATTSTTTRRRPRRAAPGRQPAEGRCLSPRTAPARERVKFTADFTQDFTARP